ncbi:MAG: hypothetical protein K9W43_14275 [Candidatus Thorarchaeota archaeon]|nr:hypothetical protein [Candidatus Thorarchaeota archaeon]
MKMRRGVTTTSLACVVLLTIMLGIQLVAVTAWTADAANEGPSIVILQLSDDPDTAWAVNDLMGRLHGFITDDPYFVDRVTVQKTSDPFVAEHLEGAIVIYATHGGPLGLVTGHRLTSWPVMARIVERSSAIMHLFMACDSKNIIRYGDEASHKKLYTVPGARPAEVTNVEITAAVLLALGHTSEEVEAYRTRELTRAKDLVQSGTSVHIMDFEQVILNEIDYIDDHYSDTYTDTHRVYRYAETVTFSGIGSFSSLPLDLQQLIMQYYSNYWIDLGVGYEPDHQSPTDVYIVYTKNYYYEATWVVDVPPPVIDDPQPTPDTGDPAPDPGDPTLYSTTYFEAESATGGHWEYGPDIFSGGTYSGVVKFAGDTFHFTEVCVNVTASGSEVDSVDSISLNMVSPGGVYVTKQKVDGVWQEPVTGRTQGRTGGLWTDPCTRCDYERDDSWPYWSHTIVSGHLYSNGEYIYPTGIEAGPNGWRGTSFVRTLPSYFRLKDFGSFAVNMSMLHNNDGRRMGTTYVSFYDENRKPAIVLQITDAWGYTSGSAAQRVYMAALFYREDGSRNYLSTDYFYGDFNGIAQIRYDPFQGLFANVPGKNEASLYKWFEVNENRLIKYVVIQSSRYGSYPEHDDRIYNIRLSYAGSEYTVFHDTCNDMNEFHSDPTFPFGARSAGELVSPSGQSYMTWSSIATGSGWHGPVYTHVLDRPFRLYQLSEFSVVGELIQSASTMGKTYVALFDENKHIVMMVYWGDAWVGATKGWFNVYFYPQDSSSGAQSSGYLYSSFKKTGKLWWGPFQGGQGAVYASINGQSDGYPIAECDNASRVIKYVAILGYRSSSYNLVQMRIHDINVVADLNRHDPTAPDPDKPVSFDGTGTGVTEQPSALVEGVSAVLSSFLQAFDVYWDLINFWPRLFLQFTGLIDGTLKLLVSTDLRGNFRIHTLNIESSAEHEHTEAELQNAATEMETQYNDFISRFVFPVAFGLTLALGLKAIETVASPLVIGTNLGVLLVMLAAWTVAFISYLVYLNYMVTEGLTHPFAAAAALFGLIRLLYPGIGYALGMAWFMFGLWTLLRPFDALPSGSLKIGLWFATIILLKIAVLVTCIYYIAKFLAIGFGVS